MCHWKGHLRSKEKAKISYLNNSSRGPQQSAKTILINKEAYS